MGFENPTPIQRSAIPLILEGKDVVSLAETGSGKTAAYLIPIISQIIKNAGAQVLILAPTRELATQIEGVVRELTHFSHELKCTVIIGGAPMGRQIQNLKRQPQIIVATPGRLMDHLRQKTVNLKRVAHLVLDEADRMFDMGFAPQVREILKTVPTKRQTMLFSATFPKEVRSLAEQILNQPHEIEVRKDSRPPVVIRQEMIVSTSQDKNNQTLDLINAAKGSVIIFTRTKSRTDRLAKYLDEYGVAVTRLHGDRSQGQRNQSISGFKSGRFRVMVATDIAARGLDVSDISDVINYDIPMTTEDYVHRIGRTGRAGQSGQAYTLVTPEEIRSWAQFAKKMGLPAPAKPQHQGGTRAQAHAKPQGHGKPGSSEPLGTKPNRNSRHRRRFHRSQRTKNSSSAHSGQAEKRH